MDALVYQSFSDELVKLALAKTDKKRALAIYEALRKTSPVPIRVTSEADQHGGGYFDQSKREIGISKKKDWQALAHELGHAELDKHILGRMAQHPIVRTLFNFVPVFGAGAGILMAKGQKWGLLLPLAATAPTLISEAMATSKGKKTLEGLEKLKIKPEEMEDYQKKLRGAFMTYGAIPLQGAILGAFTYFGGTNMRRAANRAANNSAATLNV